jgi:hypothetical protein
MLDSSLLRPLQGIDRVFYQVLDHLDQSVTNFERLCAVTCLQVPAELFLQQVRAPAFCSSTTATVRAGVAAAATT